MWSTVWSDGAFVLEDGLHRKAAHQHHAVQLSIALDGAALGSFDGSPHELPFRGVIIAPNRRHALRGKLVSLLFEPHGPSGQCLWRLCGQRGFQRVEHLALEGFQQNLGSLELLDPARAQAAALQLVSDLCAAPSPGLGAQVFSLDDRVAEVRAMLRRDPGEKLGLEALAESVKLSPSRLRHLFAEQVGLPIRNYVVWLRTLSGMASMLRGANVGMAAHQVGFADQAAFARSYRTTWGIAPSTFSRVVTFPEREAASQGVTEGWLAHD